MYVQSFESLLLYKQSDVWSSLSIYISFHIFTLCILIILKAFIFCDFYRDKMAYNIQLYLSFTDGAILFKFSDVSVTLCV